ncbi:hypothetical protein PTSG_11556 [Salpingoeca rosetta]|uniref:Importin N-terminal domain-containing protein n=1 Tax=Salpingoeca rosetta (strain ATCC 50818 / BSB-021) TaxID=946362 RepID=F2TVP9_SALR5|nr:uncharacterized protein PTSG_11556 [Salpingoeca rosetta]EGD72145.1 hypothetical protein PTSG_11556 [Salpingoeca rosetta]|eukprot:XP_004998717.1 hypothetical protein PTSG_11556 [Salpingoeca rosetta]
MEHLVAALEATLSTDQNEREAAQNWLDEAKANDKPGLMGALANALVTVDYTTAARQQAGLQLKNCISGQHGLIREEERASWTQIDDSIRTHIKQCALNTLGTEKSHPSTAAQVYAAVSTIEVPLGMWPDAVPMLLSRLDGEGVTEDLTVSVMDALGYLTGDITDIDPNVLQPFANDILTAVVGAMTSSTASAKVQTAAIKALANSIEFCRDNFNSKDERDHIMMAVCNSTLSGDAKVVETSIQCLVDIADVYYHHLQEYMNDALFPIMNTAMRSETTEIALQGIEFWTTIAERELELEDQAEDQMAKGLSPSEVSANYCLAAQDKLLPVLLKLLAQQEEEEDEDEWTVSKAAAVCLGIIAEVIKDAVVDPVLQFVQSNLGHEDWRYRDASILAFGSILSGPSQDKLAEIVVQAALPIVNLIQDNSVVVQDSVAWILGRMIELFPEIMLTPEIFPSLLEALGFALSLPPRVSTNSCWSISSLAEECFNVALSTMDEDAYQPPSYLLSQQYSTVMGALIQVSQRDDLDESGLGVACFDAISSLIQFSAADCYPHVAEATSTFLGRLEATLTMQPQTAEQYKQLLAMQGFICQVLQPAITVLEASDVKSISDKIVMSVVQLLRMGGKSGSEAAEDAFGVISALLRKLERDFAPYFDTVKPLVVEALQNTQHSQTCLAAVGALSDMLLALQDQVKPYVQEFLSLLMEVVAVPDVDRSIKPQVISTFGDFAQAIGRDIVVYLQMLLPVLKTASESATTLESDDEDDIAFMNQLRENILETYTNILQALTDENAKATPELTAISGDIAFVLQFITHICSDPTLSDAVYCVSAGFIGDCLRAFGNEIKGVVSEELVQHILSRAKESGDAKFESTARWMYGHYTKM